MLSIKIIYLNIQQYDQFLSAACFGAAIKYMPMKPASTANPINDNLVSVTNKLMATKEYAAIKIIGNNG